MTIDELWQVVVASGHEHDYVLNDTARPPGAGLPSSVTVVEPVGDGTGRWVVFFTERGEIIEPQYFADEDAACRHVHAEMTAPRPAARALTDAERAQAKEIASGDEARRRELIRAAGFDPDTMQPLA